MLFETDAQYRTSEGCEHPVPPSPISLPEPAYPKEEIPPVPQQVQVSAIINKNGTLDNLVVSHSAGTLDTYALDALRMWKFVPATCEDRAVPFPLSTIVSFKK